MLPLSASDEADLLRNLGFEYEDFADGRWAFRRTVDDATCTARYSALNARSGEVAS
jgi:hypothetical protein